MSEFCVVCVTLIRSETSVSSEIELIRRHAHGKTPDVQTLRHVRLTALALTSHSGKEKTGWGKERSVGTGYLFLWGGLFVCFLVCFNL